MTTQGSQCGDSYVLEGLTVIPEYDGYSVTLKNDFVSLVIHFHNRFSFIATNRREERLFLEKLDRIARNAA